MVAKGKNCSDLFPAVVKNVVSKNSEVCWGQEGEKKVLGVSVQKKRKKRHI